jgi:hypothetical protein
VLTSPPRACSVLIIPGVAGFYLETKRGLLTGIQLKPAANICFDAAGRRWQRQEPQAGTLVRVNQAAGMRAATARWLALLAGAEGLAWARRAPPPAAGPGLREGCPALPAGGLQA